MKTRAKILGVGAILLFVAAGLIWQLALRNERMHTAVFEEPLDLAQGRALTNAFKVHFRGPYWVELVCARTNLSLSEFERLTSVFRKRLPIRFNLTSDGKVLLGGDTVNPFTVSSAREITRNLGIFVGEAGRDYQVALDGTGAIPFPAGSKPTLRIKLSQGLSVRGILLHLCTYPLAAGLAGGGVLLAVLAWGSLLGKTLRHNSQDARPSC